MVCEQLGKNIFRSERGNETLEELSKLKAALANKTPNGNQLVLELVQSVTETL